MSLIGLLARGFGFYSAPPVPPPVVDATLIRVADAVVYQLNIGTFSIPLTAVRYYQPRFQLADMQSLHISVVPRALRRRPFTRALEAYDYDVDIGIQQRKEPTATQLDPLMGLVQEIDDYLRNERLSTFEEARRVNAANEPVYAAEHLEELRQFTSVLTLTYRVWR